MPAIGSYRWPSNSICLLPEPVTECRPSSRPCSKFATHPKRSQEQMLGKVRGRLTAGKRLPAGLQASQVEIAPARDLLLEGSCLAGIKKRHAFSPSATAGVGFVVR